MRPRQLATIALTLGLALLLGWPASAQTNMLGLSKDDYALLTAANKTPVKSYAFQYTAQLAIKGLDTFAIDANLKGSGAVDRTAHALDLSVGGPLTLGTAQKFSTNAEVKWIGSAMYFNPGDGWQERKDASAFITQWVGRILGVGVNAAALAKWDTSAIVGLHPAWMAWLKIDPSTFVTAKRLDDAAVGDVKTAHFQLTVNLQALLKTDGFLSTALAFSQAQGSMLQVFGRAKAKTVLLADSVVFKDTTLTLDQYIGMNDDLIHREGLAVNMPLDPSLHKNTDKPFTATANFDISFSGQNQPQQVAAPDGAKAVTAFSFPAETKPAAAGSGITEYVYFETIAKKGTYQRSFDAQANDHVTITSRGWFDFASIAKLLSPDGQTVAEDDGYTSQAFALSDRDAQIADFTIPKDGIYTAQVNDDEQRGGSFILTITIKR